jgi:diguanylate cyclase (GGDEF)-like protein
MMKRPTILVVDDEISNIEIMHAILEEDYEICFAMSGQEALTTIRKSQPDLVLLDIVLPDLSGFEVCEAIKGDPQLADIPIIFTTGLGEAKDEIRGLSLGAIDYVTKPIEPVILRARVNNHVELKRLRDQLADLAVKDTLTGLHNRRALEKHLNTECVRLSRTSDWLSVIMVDIDFFKQFNDTYGHPAGDRCIAMVAAALARAVKRVNDVSARYGGEEFACILPGSDSAAAELVAQEIRLQVQSLNIPHELSQVSPFVTGSVGVASARCEVDAVPDRWIAVADAQLYQSKLDGRNRISIKEFKVLDERDRALNVA